MSESKTKWSYYFGEGRKEDKDLLGGKGANLSEMSRIGLPVPAGFTLTTRACVFFSAHKRYPQGLREQMDAHIARLERDMNKKFGGGDLPLLLSVRSGAKVSMPGMMDTVLNLGLNDDNVRSMARSSGNERWAYDSYRRFIQMYSDVVKGIHKEHFRDLLDNLKTRVGVSEDTALTTAHLKELCGMFKDVYRKETGKPFPTDPRTQLYDAVNAVFSSWDNPRAIKYRELNNLDHDLGTAVNVQAMVYGNMGETSGTGVAFTRNPSTGENHRYGEYLMNAQGEDVVAGIRTPLTLSSMKQQNPRIYDQLFSIFDLLENHYRDMQDIEFTIQEGKLYILQTRNGKRTAPAAVRMAVEMLREKMITPKVAVTRVTTAQLELLLHKQLDPKEEKRATVLAQGLPASPGAAVGQVVFDSVRAQALVDEGKQVILVRLETSPDDIQGMHVANGILTARGGMTSHAAVVARGMNRCCIAGCKELRVDGDRAVISTSSGTEVTLREGDWLSLNGTSGKVYEGKMGVVTPTLQGEFSEFLSVADSVRSMEVYANCDTPEDAQTALDFGAQGIGLVRTEHMFFVGNRIRNMREMILAADGAGRERALAKLLPFQRDDFYGILKVMSGKPVVIRLIDPPLHEFLPHSHENKEIRELAGDLRVSEEAVRQKIRDLHEVNPMLGFRGCRLGVVYPEINRMQVTAIFEASLRLLKEGFLPMPRIEIPLVGNVKEFLPLKEMVLSVARELKAEGRVEYEVGTMIEVPRAALTANELAPHADFLSFGTNDLTQMTCGFSRDDAGSFLGEYTKQGIYKRDPFQSLDGSGVAKLMNLCCQLARSENPQIDIGICGEHGGDPDSITICQRLGLNNISCSPYRIPVARLAAAQAAVKYGKSASVFFTSKL